MAEKICDTFLSAGIEGKRVYKMEEKITFAKEAWVPSLKQIWRECFHDEDAYIDFFFEHRFREENTLVWLEEAQPVAMVSLLPCVCWVGEGSRQKKQPVRYIYAVATKPAYEGRGISTRLMHYVKELLQKKQEVGILVPAEESLISFYQKRGFYPAIYAESRTKEGAFVPELQASALTDLQILEGSVSAERYKQIRDSRLGRDGYVEWDRKAIDYALRENHLGGGFAVEIMCGGRHHLMMGYCSRQTLTVRETTLSDWEWQKYAMDIAHSFACSSILEKERFCMSTQEKWAKTAYFNLALD